MDFNKDETPYSGFCSNVRNCIERKKKLILASILITIIRFSVFYHFRTKIFFVIWFNEESWEEKKIERIWRRKGIYKKINFGNVFFCGRDLYIFCISIKFCSEKVCYLVCSCLFCSVFEMVLFGWLIEKVLNMLDGALIQTSLHNYFL